MTVKTELLKHYICNYVLNSMNDLEIDENNIVDTMAIKILKKIQQILQKESTDFDKVEEIVCLFEKYDIDAGGCHDFG